ncbi:hypothetical protein SAMN04488243_12122 [Thermus arciformis]|uniref:Uncharacterized protein n=1 Tax=Thermus arciformis TaxID=482827 RepID=A0A1G7HS00_9DEIN|nr:hypothetical protein [Thermus arciformis]SDF03113.1 hypothetical protein SAMN04488243_12122 [Thermus arciformis]
MRAFRSTPWVFLFLALLGLAVLGLVWLLAAVALLIGLGYEAWQRIRGPRWRRLPPPR